MFDLRGHQKAVCLFLGLVGLAEEYSFSFFWTSLPPAIAAASTDIAAFAFATSYTLPFFHS